ncbi:MAG: hypothetical protein P1T08_15685 [Acidimicrobiia bacterium]|nr:hypothetical protein [Acidimicrobiia bacterium]
MNHLRLIREIWIKYFGTSAAAAGESESITFKGRHLLEDRRGDLFNLNFRSFALPRRVDQAPNLIGDSSPHSTFLRSIEGVF